MLSGFVSVYEKSPLDVINETESVRLLCENGSGTIVKLDDKQLGKFKSAAEKISVKNVYDCEMLYFPITGTVYCVDYKRAILNFINTELESFLTANEISILKNTNVWNLILFSSLWSHAELLFKQSVYESAINRGLNLSNAKIVEEVNAGWLECRSEIVKIYLRPKLKELVLDKPNYDKNNGTTFFSTLQRKTTKILLDIENVLHL